MGEAAVEAGGGEGGEGDQEEWEDLEREARRRAAHCLMLEMRRFGKIGLGRKSEE